MKRILFKPSVLFFVFLMTLVVGVGQPREVNAAAHITFNATSVNLPGGCTEIEGVFLNSGDSGATVYAAAMKVNISDTNGNHIWSDSCNFSNMSVYVPAGSQIRHRFTIHNGKCPRYNGRIRWNVNNDIWF